MPTVLKASSQDFTSSSFADVTGMGLAVEANLNYRFRYVVHYITGVNDALRLAINGPASPSALRIGGIIPSSGTTFGNGTQTAYNTTIFPSTTAAAVERTAYVEGIFKNGANAGTLILRAATEVSETVTILAGTMGELESTLATIEGTTSQTIADVTSSMSGAPTIVGTMADSVAAVTSSMSGTPTVLGSMAASLEAFTSSITGTVVSPISGTIAITIAAVTSSIAGTVTVLGSMAAVVANVIGAFSGTTTIKGTIAAVVENVVASMSGTSAGGAVGPSWIRRAMRKLWWLRATQ